MSEKEDEFSIFRKRTGFDRVYQAKAIEQTPGLTESTKKVLGLSVFGQTSTANAAQAAEQDALNVVRALIAELKTIEQQAAAVPGQVTQAVAPALKRAASAISTAAAAVEGEATGPTAIAGPGMSLDRLQDLLASVGTSLTLIVDNTPLNPSDQPPLSTIVTWLGEQFQVPFLINGKAGYFYLGPIVGTTSGTQNINVTGPVTITTTGPLSVAIQSSAVTLGVAIESTAVTIPVAIQSSSATLDVSIQSSSATVSVSLTASSITLDVNNSVISSGTSLVGASQAAKYFTTGGGTMYTLTNPSNSGYLWVVREIAIQLGSLSGGPYTCSLVLRKWGSTASTGVPMYSRTGITVPAAGGSNNSGWTTNALASADGTTAADDSSTIMVLSSPIELLPGEKLVIWGLASSTNAYVTLQFDYQEVPM